MKAIKPLVRITHGSHLYGTNTATSDQDFKGVHLPSGNAIILQRAENCIDSGIKISETIKNSSEDVDDQSYSLQKFFKMVSDGDTVGTEILFAPIDYWANPAEEWDKVLSHRSSLINKKCKGFVGYCKQQAAKYGIKGSRMAAVEDFLNFIKRINLTDSNSKLGTLAFYLKDFADSHDHCEIVPITNQSGEVTLHLEIVGKKVPYTATVKTAYDLFSKVYDNYGERARLAKANEGIDWKALSHAVRVARQAIELLTTGFITFPRPDAAELLAIKQGKFDYAHVADLLEGLVEQVEAASAASTLPETSNHKLIDQLVTEFYLGQV